MAVNTQLFRSEVGNKLSARSDCDVAALWEYNLKEKCFKISLRSTRAEHDVSDIARKLGGGGHPKAASFKWAGPSIESLFETDPQ